MAYVNMFYVKYWCSPGFIHERQPSTRPREGTFHSSAFGHGCTKQQLEKDTIILGVQSVDDSPEAVPYSWTLAARFIILICNIHFRLRWLSPSLIY